MYTGALLESVEGRLILWLVFTSVMWQGVGSNSWPLYLQSDALATALSRRACVMIMSDCKSCVLFLSKKTNKQKNIRSLFFPQKFDRFWQFMPPTSKNLEGHIVFALFVISFVFFSGDWNIFMYYLLPQTKLYNSSISEILFSFIFNHTMYQLGTC